MKQRTTLNIAYCLGALVLGVSPLIYSISMHGSLPLHVVTGINFIAWLAVSLKQMAQTKMLRAVDMTLSAMGFTATPGSLERKLNTFLAESTRLHKAAYAFHTQRNLSGKQLTDKLRHVTMLAYQELDAKCVELSLYDEESELWSQAMMLGRPTTFHSQGMLVKACNEEIKVLEVPKTILAQAVSFAGTMFGTLRVELWDEPKEADRQVLNLLATQGAMMLLDARFTDELLRMRSKGEESTRAKTGFLANLSHEIRGPLGIILNGTELVLEGLCGPITENQRETCEMVKNNGEHLLDLVNDVLDYAKVEAGKVVPKPVEIPVHALLSDLAKVVRSQAHAKGHKLVVDPVDPTIGVQCDKRHIRQMLINFLTNAIKYTPDGGEIYIKAARLPNNRVKISVRDTGIGIPESERDKVFSAFERVDHDYALAQVGTGLGMPLTARLAEVNKGTVDFSSEEGRGSIFWLNLPACAIEAMKNAGEEKDGVQNGVPQGHGEPILLVDHDQEARQMLERYLVHQGFQIIHATSGAEVTRVLREKKIQLAVVENDMPGFPGEELISVIRSNPGAAKVPIILLSSRAFVFDIERFLKLGVDRCLSKPVELFEVASTARRLIDETKTVIELR